MDRISLMSDDLIFKILSFVPSKVAVTTSLLSTRWGSLWKHMPMLKYCDPSKHTEHWRASRFVDKFLLLHKAPVLDTLDVSLSQYCPPTDIETWISIVVSRGVRTLRLHQQGAFLMPIRLPKSLFTCQTLVTLTLKIVNTLNVPLTICFRSLKVFFLVVANFSSGDEPVSRLLSGCPVLEDLKLVRHGNNNVKTLTIAVPSLQRLLVIDVDYFGSQAPGDDVGFVLKTPSLKSLTIVNQFYWVCSLVKMPKLVKANIRLRDGDSKKLLGCLTSAKHLFLCLKPPMDSYLIGVFSQLVSLKLCTCSLDGLRLILRHTPILQILRFQLQEKLLPKISNVRRCCTRYGDVQTQWEKLSFVPQCLISSLQTVEWNCYKGTEEEKKVVMYLLENSGQLKTMAIISLPSTNLEVKHNMLIELADAPRSSVKCRLSFT